MNLINLLKLTVNKYPEKTACIVTKTDEFITFKGLYEKIDNYSAYLENFIHENEFAGLKVNNGIEWIAIFFALLKIGAIPVLIDFAFTQREVFECMQITKCQKIIIELKNKDPDFIANSKDKNIDVININDIKDCKSGFVKSKKKYSKIVLFSYRGFGYPLACLFDEKAIIRSSGSCAIVSEVTAADNVAHLLPSTHIFALTSSIITPLLQGSCIVIVNNIMPGEILKSFEKYKVTYIIAVPTVMKILIETWKKRKSDLSSFKRGITGGQSLSDEMYSEWFELTGGGKLLQGYGLTETSPVICNSFTDNIVNSIGKKMRGVKTKINKNGILFIKTKNMMKRYMNETDDITGIYKDGWFDTGDVVEKKGNYYYFIRRNKNIGKIGGNTIDIKEIEKILDNNYNIINYKLKLEPDDIWGEKIICIVKTEDLFTKDQLMDYLRDNLAGFKIPKDIIIEN